MVFMMNNLDTLYSIGQWLVLAGFALLIADWLRRHEIYVEIRPRGSGLPDDEAPAGAILRPEDVDWIEKQADRL
jgi:hypothetical protein